MSASYAHCKAKPRRYSPRIPIDLRVGRRCGAVQTRRHIPQATARVQRETLLRVNWVLSFHSTDLSWVGCGAPTVRLSSKPGKDRSQANEVLFRSQPHEVGGRHKINTVAFDLQLKFACDSRYQQTPYLNVSSIRCMTHDTSGCHTLNLSLLPAFVVLLRALISPQCSHHTRALSETQHDKRQLPARAPLR